MWTKWSVIVIKTLVISSQPYAQWLAESLSFLENRKIDKIAIVAIDKTNGEVITGYHNCTFADKAVMAANIQADAIYGSVLANADQIVQEAEDIANSGYDQN